MKRYFYTLFYVLLLFSFSTQSKELKLGYPEFKPYSYTKNGEAKGSSIEFFSQLAKRLSLDVEFIPVESHGSGFARLQKNVIDGMFPATQNSQRDQIGNISTPIDNNPWSWFLLKRQNKNYQALIANKEIRVGTLNKTNTHTWLLSNNYNGIAATNDLSAVLRQIHSERIEAIFVSERVLKDKLRELQLGVQDFHIIQQVNMPLGIYLSNQYFAKNKDFLPRLNAEIIKLRASQKLLIN